MRRQTKRRDKLGIARDTASRVSTEKSLSFRVGNGTSNLRPRPAFLKSGENNMERADLLYSGLMFAAGMLSLWTALLLTATFVALAPALRKSAPSAATISSTRSHASTHHGAEEPTPPSSLSEALPQRSVLGRPLRSIQ